MWSQSQLTTKAGRGHRRKIFFLPFLLFCFFPSPPARDSAGRGSRLSRPLPFESGSDRSWQANLYTLCSVLRALFQKSSPSELLNFSMHTYASKTTRKTPASIRVNEDGIKLKRNLLKFPVDSSGRLPTDVHYLQVHSLTQMNSCKNYRTSTAEIQGRGVIRRQRKAT